MRSIRTVLGAFREAHGVIREAGFLKVLAVPVALTVLYLPVLVWLCWLLSGWVSGWALSFFPGLGEWAEWFLRGLLLVLVGFVGVVSYRGVVLVFYAPFLEKVAERVEVRLRGEVADPGRPWTGIVQRVLGMMFLTVGVSLALLVADLGVSLIPLVGGAVTLFLLFPIQLFLASVGYVDPYLDRRGYGPRASFRLMRRHFWTLSWFTVVSGGFLVVPVIGWFLAPAYSVVAGVVVGLRLEEWEGAIALPSTVKSE